MTANVSMPMSTPKTAAPSAARAAPRHAAAQPGSADDKAQSGFDRQLDQLLRQPGAAALATGATPPALPGHVTVPAAEADALLAGKDGDGASDPAERNGNALAAAVLALLGQGASIAHPAAGSAHGQTLSPDAGKGGAQRGLPGFLVADGAKDALASAAPMAAGGADAGALISTVIEAAAPAVHKTSEPGSNIEALAATMTPQAPAANVAHGVHTLKMDAPVGNSAFAQELGQQVAWLGGQEIKEARIRLRPEELGQLDVKVSVAEHGRVDVSFTAQHPAAVTAVQQTLGQLDLMLAGHGLSLGQAQVGQQGAGERGQGQGEKARDAVASNESEPMKSAPLPLVVGLLDTFA
ncbi:flagellar hook-length control protein FliK [Dyella sp. BiH032]|uniref:flagellar hook-length control protein FliK n=1 Tax=Dyella sp. BiH032 TaxID=3075430 RepID=UPI002892EF2E|nr:flagellar hook-length control protein FliK [Dyella sp. BiH032]WNL47263.1 flagellar hook-length control protein FliK [Dyella sp. BiH032]